MFILVSKGNVCDLQFHVYHTMYIVYALEVLLAVTLLILILKIHGKRVTQPNPSASGSHFFYLDSRSLQVI